MSSQTFPALAAIAGVLCSLAVAEETMFPFVISYDATENVTNVSSWLHRPAGKHGFVRSENGRLVTDAGPIRFWATNFCFAACFPTHEVAERVAARLARLGINCVRMHHMDSRHIWGDSPDKTTIDPKMLERLDYLIFQLKRHGVYVNLNLHVSRWLGDKEGFPHQRQRPNYDKGTGNFEPRMIELQKKYARDLLAHVNPYTKAAYVDEPAVAFVEISNEDALFAVWQWGQLDGLPDPYATTFRKLWNAWLRRKYTTQAALEQAWNVGRKPLGQEMLANGSFIKPFEDSWHLETDEQVKASWTIRRGTPRDGKYLRLVVERGGTVSWRPQLAHGGFALKKGEPYTLAVLLKADKERRIGINCMMAHEPWRQLGLSTSVKVGTKWQTHRLAFVAPADDPNARITFTSLRPGTYSIGRVSLRPGGIVGLERGLTLEDESVPVVKKGEMNVTAAARRDWADFLWDAERNYWWGLRDFLKKELKVRSLVAGTQLSYSPAHVQAGLDYIDAHSYWQHPHFPGRPWDMGNWTVNNIALVNQPGGTLAGLAARRVAGKAFTVSEYNHPAPNQYAAEGLPMIAAFGAFQRWDGIFPFAYCHNDRFEPRKIESFFDYKSDPQKIAHQIACAALFLRGDAAPARKTLLAPLSPTAERQKLHDSLSAWTLTSGSFGVDPRLSLLHAIALDLERETTAAPPELPKDAVFVSDTGQLRWDLSQKGAGCFMADTPRTKLFTGFIRGRTFALGDVSLKIGKTTLDWATVSMVCIDGKDFASPGRILIAATGLVHNKGAKLEDLGGSRVTLRRNWGTAPILCEGIPAEIALPAPAAKATLYPLDERGDRREAVPVASRGGKAIVTIGAEHRTIWYEVVIQ